MPIATTRASLCAPQWSFSAIQVGFWMSFCVSVSFAAVYLQALGYSNGALGLILALGNLMGVLVSLGLSAWIDQSPRVTSARLLPHVLALQTAAVLLLLANPAKGPLTSAAFVSYIGFSTTVNALNLKLYADADHAGCRMDYAFTRGMGSVAYVAISVALGFLMGWVSYRVVPALGLALCAFQYLAFRHFARYVSEDDKAAPSDAAGVSALSFVRDNPRFCVLLVGVALLYFGHSTACNFLINLTRRVGGSTEDMGLLTGFKGLVEIPTMLFYDRLFRNRNHALAIRIAACAFVAKTVAFIAAASVGHLMLAFVLQAPSYGLFMAAIVPYVRETISYADSAKAQSLAFTATVVGGMLANLVAGQLFDHFDVTTTLYVALAVGVLGGAVTLAGTRARCAATVGRPLAST